MLTSLLSPHAAVSTDIVAPLILLEKADGSGWYDISADLMSGSIKRGKQRELDQFQAGTMSLTLRNETRSYDPNYASSPYNGSILPMRRIHVMNAVQNVLYSQGVFYVDSWQQNYTGPHSATVTITGFDAFNVLANRLLATSPYAQEVLTDTPIVWWRLGEAAGTTTVTDTLTQTYILTTSRGTPTFGATGLVASEADTAMSFADVNSGYLGSNLPPPFTTGPLSLEFTIKTSTGAAANIFTVFTSYLGYGIEISGSSHGWVCTISTPLGGLGTASTTSSGIVVDDGLTHHCVATWNSAGTISVYQDGVLLGLGTNSSLSFGTDPVGQVALASVAIPAGTFTGFVGTIDEIVLYNTALSATRVLAHYNAMHSAWSGDTPSARANRVLDDIGWDTVARVISTGVSVLQAPTDYSGQSALAHLQKVAQSEFGKVYIDMNGRVVLESRDDGIDQASQGTFVDAHNAGLGVTMMEPEYSGQLIRNDVTIQRAGGIPRIAKDATSITQYLDHGYSLTGLYHNSDATSLSAAQVLVTNYKNPIQRVRQLVLQPREIPATLFPQALGRELTDWITVVYTPQGLGSAFTQTTVIEGIQHDFGPKAWKTTWSLSPADTTAYWELGVTGFGELGTNTRLFF